MVNQLPNVLQIELYCLLRTTCACDILKTIMRKLFWSDIIMHRSSTRMFMYGDYDSGSFSTVREQKCVEHGWLRNGAVVRSLASNHNQGSILARCIYALIFSAVIALLQGFSPGSPNFSLRKNKQNIPKFNQDRGTT